MVNVRGHVDTGLQQQLSEIHHATVCRAQGLPCEELTRPKQVLLSIAGRNYTVIRSHTRSSFPSSRDTLLGIGRSQMAVDSTPPASKLPCKQFGALRGAPAPFDTNFTH